MFGKLHKSHKWWMELENAEDPARHKRKSVLYSTDFLTLPLGVSVTDSNHGN